MVCGPEMTAAKGVPLETIRDKFSHSRRTTVPLGDACLDKPPTTNAAHSDSTPHAQIQPKTSTDFHGGGAGNTDAWNVNEQDLFTSGWFPSAQRKVKEQAK